MEDTQARLDADVRLAVYRNFAETGRALSPADLAAHFELPPVEIEALLRRLQDDHHALVLLPGSTYIWMANPFSALPTSFAVTSGRTSWWGNCIWDSLGIAALLNIDADVETLCPDCGQGLRIEIRDGEPVTDIGLAHFVVPARDWWTDLGFT